MRIWLVLGLLIGLGGCMDDGGDPAAGIFPLEVYRFSYPGSDLAVTGSEHGWLLRISNPTDRSYRTTILPFGVQEGIIGPVGRTAGQAPQDVFLPVRIEGGIADAPPAVTLAPGASAVFMAKISAYDGDGTVHTGFTTFAAPAADPEAILDGGRTEWDVEVVPATRSIAPGDHVQTRTVGVWTNGTSFYTNIEALDADPAFPAGYPAADFDGATLPVYVYDQSRDEQPAGSQDACYFTTITGYNRMLKGQAEGSTAVTLMRPEDAYTREGNEDHLLYGDALVFLNTVVAYDGTTGPLDQVPDPLGPCFALRPPVYPSGGTYATAS